MKYLFNFRDGLLQKSRKLMLEIWWKLLNIISLIMTRMIG